MAWSFETIVHGALALIGVAAVVLLRWPTLPATKHSIADVAAIVVDLSEPHVLVDSFEDPDKGTVFVLRSCRRASRHTSRLTAVAP